MFTSGLSVVAVILTVSRSWPQFARIVMKKDRAGVSVVTWALALASHVGFFMYGVLSPVPLLIVVNLLAGAGCAAITWVLRSPLLVLGVVAVAATASTLAFAVADGALLALITPLAIGMFIPQLVRVFRTSARGVSPTAWVLAALSSTTWIAWAWAIDRPSIVIAHFFMLPASLAILKKTFSTRAGGRSQEVAAPV